MPDVVEENYEVIAKPDNSISSFGIPEVLLGEEFTFTLHGEDASEFVKQFNRINSIGI